MAKLILDPEIIIMPEATVVAHDTYRCIFNARRRFDSRPSYSLLSTEIFFQQFSILWSDKAVIWIEVHFRMSFDINCILLIGACLLHV